jgi:hypothetical protein
VPVAESVMTYFLHIPRCGACCVGVVAGVAASMRNCNRVPCRPFFAIHAHPPPSTHPTPQHTHPMKTRTAAPPAARSTRAS